jgi:RNA polymerase sigma-70 factor (ECF subfamily)
MEPSTPSAKELEKPPEPQKLPDKVLRAIKALMQGQAHDPEWRVLWEHFAPKLEGVAYKYGLSTEERKDVVQNTFLKVFNYGETLRDENRFWPFFWRIACREAITIIKKRGQDGTPPDDELVDRSNSEAEIHDRLQLEECFKKMPSYLRQTCLLFWVQNLPQKEVARIVQVKIKTVQEYLYRARQFLRQCLEEKVVKTEKVEMAGKDVDKPMLE